MPAGNQPSSAFPSQGELERIAATPASIKDVQGANLVNEWKLVGPLPEAIALEPHENKTPWGRLLIEITSAAPGSAASAAMHCTARELGRFHLKQRAQPPQGLIRFIASRCGSAAIGVVPVMMETEVPDDVSDDQLHASLKSALRSSLGERLRAARNPEAGVWVGRQDGRAVVVMAIGERQVELTEVARTPDDNGWIRISGRVLIAVGQRRALMNMGQFGVRPCEFDPLVPLPRFTILCAPDRGDATAWIELSVTEPERVLGNAVLQVLTWPGGTPPTRYQRFVYSESAAMPESDEQVAAALLERVNAVRASAGQKPLELASEQSAMAGKLAPHFFAASSADKRQSDSIALGLMAGWQINGMIRQGWFIAQLLGNTDDLGDLVAATLESPFGRQVLLTPETRYLSLGPVVDRERKLLGSLFTSYAVVESFSRGLAAQQVLVQLTEARARQGLEAPLPLMEVTHIVNQAAGDVLSGAARPAEAMNRALEQAAAQQRDAVRGWMLSASSFDELVFPVELITTPTIGVALAVTMAKPENHPWGQYYVFVVTGKPNMEYKNLKLPGQ
jgi:hypothetical protein